MEKWKNKLNEQHSPILTCKSQKHSFKKRLNKIIKIHLKLANNQNSTGILCILRSYNYVAS